MEYKVVGVIFEVTKKRYYFESTGDAEYKKGDNVIVDTARGQELGVVYAEGRMLPETQLILPLKPVLRKATNEDTARFTDLRKEAAVAMAECRKKIIEHELPMKLVATEYTFDKTKLIFYFTAEGRIDFRKLVKDLAAIFRLRIELRQIGVRDEARILGDIGVCGKELCCRSFINKFDSVAIKMARDQGLVINPAKISGVCGRLLCCIRYENSQYEEALHEFPANGQRVNTNIGKGKVINLNPLNGYIYADIEGKGIQRVNIEDVEFDREIAKKMKAEEADGTHELKVLEEDYEG